MQTVAFKGEMSIHCKVLINQYPWLNTAVDQKQHNKHWLRQFLTTWNMPCQYWYENTVGKLQNYFRTVVSQSLTSSFLCNLEVMMCNKHPKLSAEVGHNDSAYQTRQIYCLTTLFLGLYTPLILLLETVWSLSLTISVVYYYILMRISTEIHLI